MIERLLTADAALERGEPEAAERLYAQVVEADPRNAIAVVGLARVALARGETASAQALAERALAIDADEAAARRLLASLESLAALSSQAAATPPQPPQPLQLPPPPGRHRGFWGFVRRLLRRA